MPAGKLIVYRALKSLILIDFAWHDASFRSMWCFVSLVVLPRERQAGVTPQERCDEMRCL